MHVQEHAAVTSREVFKEATTQRVDWFACAAVNSF